MVLVFVINDTRAMFTSTKHRMRPLFQLETRYGFVLNQEKFIRARNDTNIDLSNIIETPCNFSLDQFVQETAGRRREQSAGPLPFDGFAVYRACSVEHIFWVEVQEITPAYWVDTESFGMVTLSALFFGH